MYHKIKFNIQIYTSLALCPYEDLEVNLEVVICGNVIEFDIDLP